MTPGVIGQLTLIALTAVLAPVLAELTKRFAVPGVVIEIVLGIVLGPAVADLVEPAGVVVDFANMGLPC